MSDINLYRCSPRQTREFVMDCIEAGLVPYVSSSPGMGKSAIMKSIAEEFGLKLIDHRLSTSAPEDLTGLPRFDENGNAHFAPFTDLFPTEEQTVPDGYQGWMIFLDEFPSAPRSVQAAAYKLILDRMVGQKKLHKRAVITCAGNLMTDKAIVNPVGTAMQSRLVHIEMELNFDEWLQDVSMKEGYDSRIISFLGTNPSRLMMFNPDHEDKTFACPRTWEFVNKLLKSNPNMDSRRTPLFAGAISTLVSAEFFQFIEVYDKLIKVSDILKSPETCTVPHETAVKWATVTTMVEAATEKNLASLITYANRFDLTFRIVFFRFIAINRPELRKTAAYANGAIEIMTYLSQ